MTSTSSLSSEQYALVELMQRVGFGRIEGLVVRGGQPVLDPPPKVIREVKFGGHTERLRAPLTDFVLRKQVIQLLETIDRIDAGVIDSVEVRHGLPFRMTVTGAS